MLSGSIRRFAEQFEFADTYGSLMTVTAPDNIDAAVSDFSPTFGLTLRQLDMMMKIYNILGQKYDVVCTNPPYMGGSGMNAKLSDFVKKYFPDSKSDLFACFIEKCGQLAKSHGFYAMITQHAFMFLSSYENLRRKLMLKTTVNMAHLGARAFDEIGGEVVQTTAFVMTGHIKDYKGTYARLVDTVGENEKRDLFLSGEKRFAAKQENFSKIPGMPVAYWVSENFVRAFENPKLGEIAFPKTGFTTGDNDSFLRLWFEVGSKQINKKWFYLNKGGSFRKWYGNDEYVVDWENDGNKIKKAKGSTIRNPEFYFKEGVTWSKITSYKLSGRYSSNTHIFDAVGLTCFPSDKIDLMYILAVFNNKVSCEMMFVLNPTLSYTTGAIANLPIAPKPKELKTELESFVCENVELSKQDWDSFETSWDFEGHPLV